MNRTSSPRRLARFAVGAIAALTAVSGLVAPPTGLAASPARTAPSPLTNLAHIDWLGAEVAPPTQDGHSTYRLAEEPAIGVLWTYADRQSDGSYRRIGGGAYDPVTDTWGQGAFNADDISRAAVVYVRHWQATGAESSRRTAYQLLRGLTYLQTVEGPNAGNVVLWMQPDGTLNPSADPVELPDPSDSGESYWLARTIWALGEAYPAFVDSDPAFAAFLRDRLELALGAVERQVLDRYGEWLEIDGVAVPAWLIVDGADATGEALLGLAPYVAATGDRSRRGSCSDGSARAWPRCGPATRAPGRSAPCCRGHCPKRCGTHGAVWRRPGWPGRTRSPATGTCSAPPCRTPPPSPRTCSSRPGPRTGGCPHRPSASRSPTAPTPASSRCWRRPRPATAPASATSPASPRRGSSATTRPARPCTTRPPAAPTTASTGDGAVNRNSGAESTIHGLLTTLILDSEPDIAALASVAHVDERRTWTLVEAESGDPRVERRASTNPPTPGPARACGAVGPASGSHQVAR